MSSTWDAVVVGSGPNGLVAANLLADAGWSVLVLEEQEEVGGAVRSAADVHPGFVHDTFSAFYPLAAASPTVRSLDLEKHGLVWRHAPAVLGHPQPDGSWALLHRDREKTAANAEMSHPGDGAAWLGLCAEWDVIGESLIGALLTPFPPVRAGIGALLRLRKVGGLSFVRKLLTPAADLGRLYFGGSATRLLLAGSAGHTDIPLDAPGSGLMGVLMCMLGQSVGFPVPEGGAGGLSRALARRLESSGGEIRCGSRVRGVDLERGRARYVRTEDGERFRVSKAVIAAIAAPHLYGGLLDPADVPRRTAQGMRLPAGPFDGQGRLGARRTRAMGGAPGVRPRYDPRRRQRGPDDRGTRPGRSRLRARQPLPARRPDDHQRPDPLTTWHGVNVGLYARAAAESR